MRAKYLTGIVLLFLLMTGVISETRAQDEVPGPDLNSINTLDPNEYDEKPLLYDPEGKTSRTTIDSSSSKSPSLTPTKKPMPPAELKKSKEESDPLNFNFLFYIIQKFKSSDLMMEE